MIKICKLCGEAFDGTGRQSYCKKPITKTCPVCGKKFITYCHPDAPSSCSDKNCKKKISNVIQQEKLSSSKRTCKRCGGSFIPMNAHQNYCNKPIELTCEVCGKVFKTECTNHVPKTCSKDCSNKLAYINRNNNIPERTCKWCGQRFKPEHVSQVYCKDVHYQTCKACGNLFEIKLGVGKLSEIPVTCSEKCRISYMKEYYSEKYGVDNPMKLPEFQKSLRDSYKAKTGYDHPMHNPEVKSRLFAKYQERTGYDHPSHNPSLHVSVKRSTLERKTENVFINHKISYQCQVMSQNNGYSHKWDFYLPDYNMYIDCDGVYYHSYLDDPNGESILEDYDNIRGLTISENYSYYVIIESNFNNDITNLLNILSKTQEIFDYENYIFDWCRSSPDFPYPNYKDERLLKDYNRLCNYNNDTYNPRCKLSISSIRQFHKSMYKANVKGHLSPYDGWYNDGLLKKVIKNRGIYVNSVDPSKVLSGFNVTKLAPKVSTFNPVLARYLTMKYLSNFDEVFDPFSGYSGRMLGVCSTGKKYTGQDINVIAVQESDKIRQFHKLDASLKVQDIETDSCKSVQCILTCPPYYDIEHYSPSDSVRTCEDWITICLNKYKAEKFVFIVNDAGKYANYVLEDISNKSHFSNSKEYVVVIET